MPCRPAGCTYRAEFRPADYTIVSGCHIADVALDTETGAVKILSYHAVQDAGVAVNPMVVEGQLHGAIVQGIGAALMEKMRFDCDIRANSHGVVSGLCAPAR